MSLFTDQQIAYFMAHKNDDQRPNLIATVATCLVIPYIAVLMRIICRRIMHVPLLADDWLIIAAQFAMTSMHISIAVATSCGFGLHIIFASNLVGFAKSVLAIETSYSVAVILTKCSILSLYRRIFPVRSLIIWAYIIGVIVILYSAALIVVTFTACIPLHKLWNPLAPGWCMDTSPPFTTLAVVNVVTDAAILALPVKYVWNLQMNQTRKFFILGIFLLGSIVCVFGIIRCTAVGEANAIDPTWTNVKGGIWSAVELSVGIVCACLPTFGPLFSKILPGAGRSYGRSGGYNRHAEGRQAKSSSSKSAGSEAESGIQLPNRLAPSNAWSKVESGDDEHSDEKPFAAPDLSHTNRSVTEISHGGIKVDRQVLVY